MWKSLAFFSKYLRAPEQKYSAFDRELLTLHLAIRHCRYFLKVEFLGLYRPEAFNFLNQEIIRSLVRDITVYDERKTISLKAHRSSRRRFPVPNSSHKHTCMYLHVPACTCINYSEMASAQRVDHEVKACRTGETSLRLVDVPFDPAGETLLCDVSRGRPIVPGYLKTSEYSSLIHNISHPSVRSSQKLLTSSPNHKDSVTFSR